MTETTPTSPSGDTLASYIASMEQRLGDRSKSEYAARLRDLGAKVGRPQDALTPDMLMSVMRSIVAEGLKAESTVRAYKSAVMYWLAQQAQAQMAAGGDYEEYARAFGEVRTLKYVRKTGAPRRGASVKLKYFPAECVEALSRYVAERGHKAPTAARALAFVRANLLVGLRPSEWFNASFMSYFRKDETGEYIRDNKGNLVFEHVLAVENAKATHGRGNGPRRELMLADITAEELTALMNFWRIAQEFAARFPVGADPKKLNTAFYQPINTAIRRALDYAGYGARDVPAAYSTRHQVVADFKASDVPSREITAWFGHSSDSTHKKHYGRKRDGGRGVTFRPTPESIAQVAPPSLGRRDHTLVPPQVARDVADWVKAQESRRPTAPDAGSR